ncbi:MAG: GAF domain-containing protein [Candidatus Tectimicrobiota bacterium]
MSAPLEAVRDITTALTQEQDLALLLQRILQHAQRLLGTHSGVVYLWDESEQILLPHAWVGDVDWIRRVRFKYGEGIAGTVAQQRTGCLTNHYQHTPDVVSHTVPADTCTAALAEPLLYRTHLVGVLVLYRHEPGPGFGPADSDLLTLLAGQAALAVGGARLAQESATQLAMLTRANAALQNEIHKRQQVGATLETHARQQAVVAALGQRALRATNPLTLMAEIVQHVADTLHVEACAVLELLPEDEGLCIRANHGLPEALLAEARLSAGAETLAGYTLQVGVPVVVDDLRTERRFQSESLHHYGVVSCLSVLIHGMGRPFGLLSVYTLVQRSFSSDEVHFLEAVAHVLAGSIERQRLDTQVQQGQKMQAIGTLAGGIAHDFNNILAAILGYTELVADDVPRDSLIWQNLQHVLTAAMRARDLVQQILAFSRQSTPQRQQIQLHLLVREALALLRASLPSTIAIRQHIETNTGTVYAAPTHIHQLLIHLCTNAEHAMRATGGVLDVRLEACEVDAVLAAAHPALVPGAYVRLTVRDTGHGMAGEVLERIYEPFFTTKDVGQGTGMGLAVVHGIVASHDGAMTVTSTPGQGTTCVIYLPRSDGVEADLLVPVEPIPQGHERILLVDDEAGLVDIWQEMLIRLGYRVTAYTSSTEALAAFQKTPDHFDLMITDQTMPLLTGEGLARAVHAIRPSLPVILCTGFSHVISEDKVQALGLDAFLMKPMTGRDLGLTIRRVLAKRQHLA